MDYVIYLIIQNIVNKYISVKLCLCDIVKISQLNTFTYINISEYIYKFLNLLSGNKFELNTFFTKYQRKNSAIHEPFNLITNERVLYVERIYIGCDYEKWNNMRQVRRFLNNMKKHNNLIMFNKYYEEHTNKFGSNLYLMITNSGKCHIFYDEVGLFEMVPGCANFHLCDIDKKILALTITCDDIFSLLNLLYQHELHFLLESIKNMSN